MSKKQSNLIPCGTLIYYLQTGEQVVKGDTPVYAVESLTSQAISDMEMAERLIKSGGGREYAVHLGGADHGEETMLFLFRGLYRAAAASAVTAIISGIVLPSEAEHIRQCAAAARQSLAEENQPCGKLRAGVAIENPSAAILADLLAPLIDYFVFDAERTAGSLHTSIGSQVPLPESVRRCLNMTCAAARREGIPVLLLQ